MNAITYIAGFLALALIAAVIRIVQLNARIKAEETARAQSESQFELTARKVVEDAHESFLKLAAGKFEAQQKDGAHDLEKKQKAVADLVDPIGKALKEMEGKIENLGKAGAGLESQLKNFAQDQRLLRQETQNLVAALRNPAARGRWGEVQLQRTLELTGMVEGKHFIQQISVNTEGGRGRPDFIIRMPGGAEIVIDVKAPVEPYWDAMEKADTEAAQREAGDVFRKKVRQHLKDLGSKEYWRNFNSPEFVVMFLPTEGLYSMAISNDPALIEDAANSNVILASPTTVMGLLRMAMHGWQQQSMAEEAQKVASLASELYIRVTRFGELMQKVGRNLGTAVGAYNEAVGSLEASLLPGARKFKDMHVQTGGREIPALEPVEKAPREVAAPELLEPQKKRIA
jgi:DNA recombination protein RmuC